MQEISPNFLKSYDAARSVKNVILTAQKPSLRKKRRKIWPYSKKLMCSRVAAVAATLAPTASRKLSRRAPARTSILSI